MVEYLVSGYVPAGTYFIYLNNVPVELGSSNNNNLIIRFNRL